MESRGEIWFLITIVLVWYIQGSLASESYVFPVRSTLQQRYGINAGAGELTGRWKTRFPFESSISGFNFEYNMLHAENSEMKNYHVRSSDSTLSLILKRPGSNNFEPVIPISNLGKKYMFTSCQYSSSINTEMIIASHLTPATVKVTFNIQGNITHNGKLYFNGDSLSLNMGILETVSFKTEHDLTGSTITSTNSTVAVFVRLQRNGNELAFEQLLPVSLYGTDYIVATGSNPFYQLDVIGDHNDTIITFDKGTQVNIVMRPSYRQVVVANVSFHVTSSRPVMVTLCKVDVNQLNIDLAVVPPVSLYTKYPFVNIADSTECKFMTEDGNTSGVMLRSAQNVLYRPSWKKVTDSTFTVGTFVSFSNQPLELILTMNIGVLCFTNFGIYNGGFRKIVNSKDSEKVIDFIIPTNLSWSIYSQNNDPKGYLEIERSIPSKQFDSFSKFSYTPVSDNCIIVTDELSSLHFFGNIGDSQFAMLPVFALGFKYIISSCYPLNNQNTILMITTHEVATAVDITLTYNGTYTYGGTTYNDGDVITLSLLKCSTVTLYFDKDTTGTIIEAKTATIAVFSGIWRYSIGQEYPSEEIEALEQLLPVSQHSTKHVIDVPPSEETLLQIVTAHQDVEVTFNNGGPVSLSKNRRYNRMLNESEALVLTSSHPVMATLCRERGFVVIPPVDTYSDSHSIKFGKSGTTMIKILMDGSRTNDLQIEPIDFISTPWKNLSVYTVGTAWLISPEIHISSMDKFGVLYFNSFHVVNGGYSFTKVPPPKHDDDWTVYVIGAGTGIATTTAMAFGGFVYIRRRRRQRDEMAGKEKSESQVDRQARPTHPGPEKPPPLVRL